MLNKFSLVGLFLLAGLSASSAQENRQPDMITSRSVAVQPTPGAIVDSNRRLWVEHAMSKFLDDDTPPSEPVQ